MPAGRTTTARNPIVIAHRGASAFELEHTLDAYELAHQIGADFVEPDVVATRDGVLICNHDVELEPSTDVRSVYPDRARADGHYYATDFTLDEIRRLHRVDRSSSGAQEVSRRRAPIPTLDEMTALVQRLNERTGRSVGVIPELKRPSLHLQHGLDVADLLVSVLDRSGYTDAHHSAVIQCFEWETLARLRSEFDTRLRLLALIDAERLEQTDLDRAASIADWLGPNRTMIEDANGQATGGRDLVERVQEQGLLVTAWSFRDDVEPMARFFHQYGVDGLFADDPAAARRAAHAG